MREINGRYGRALSGSKKPVSQRKFAFYLARDMFSQVARGLLWEEVLWTASQGRRAPYG